MSVAIGRTTMPRRWLTGAEQLASINALRPVRVTMIGDSITAGSNPSTTWRFIGGMLSQICLQSSTRIINVSGSSNMPALLTPASSFGYSGLAVGGFESTAYRFNFLQDQPDAVFYWLGHNDMPSSGSPLTASQRRDLRNRIRADLNNIAQAGVVPILCELMIPSGKDRNEVLLHNAWLAQLSSETGWPLVTGLFAVMDGQQGTLTTDGVHPNPRGYVALGLVFDSFVRSWMPREHDLTLMGTQGTKTGVPLALAPGSFGSYGYDTPTGTFTRATLAQDTVGLKGSAEQVTKTGGKALVVFSTSLSIGATAAVGDWVLFSMKFRMRDCLVTNQESTFLTNFRPIGATGSFVSPFVGVIDSGSEWRTMAYAYKVPASTTSLLFELYMANMLNSGTSSTGVVEMAEVCLTNLTTTKQARNLGYL